MKRGRLEGQTKSYRTARDQHTAWGIVSMLMMQFVTSVAVYWTHQGSLRKVYKCLTAMLYTCN